MAPVRVSQQLTRADQSASHGRVHLRYKWLDGAHVDGAPGDIRS